MFPDSMNFVMRHYKASYVCGVFYLYTAIAFQQFKALTAVLA